MWIYVVSRKLFSCQTLKSKITFRDPHMFYICVYMCMCHRLLEYESDQIGKLQVYHFSREPGLRKPELKPINVETIIVGHPSSGGAEKTTTSRKRSVRDRWSSPCWARFWMLWCPLIALMKCVHLMCMYVEPGAAS